MKAYIGTKILNAKPMTRGDYNTVRGWTLPADENGDDEGYLTDNGAGHLQWQPKEVFEDAFAPFEDLDFGMAIAALKLGHRVARAGWNGKGMWLMLQPGSVITPEQARGGAAKGRADEGAAAITILPHIDMRAADGSVVVGWLASQTDMLAEDWQIIGEAA